MPEAWMRFIKISKFALSPVKDTLLYVDYQVLNNPTLCFDVNDKTREPSSNALFDLSLRDSNLRL